jgi:uncharacterized membrane protein
VGGCALLLGTAVALRPAPVVIDASAATEPATFSAVQAVMETRCVACHNAQVQQKNVALHTPALIRQHAQAIHQQTVLLRLMPMHNSTQITEAERALIGRWFAAGAPTAE